MHLLIAVNKISAPISVLEGPSNFPALAHSPPGRQATTYDRNSERISIVLLSFTVNVKGCSGKVFNVSNNKRAGTATEPSLVDSISRVAVIVVSKSDADTFN